jgi:hypothetical protein
VTRNTTENRLEGDTRLLPETGENLCGNRIGEKGVVFLNGKRLGEVTLASFHLNWCDFYGALIETEYTPKTPFKIDRVSPDALLVRGLFAYKAKPLLLTSLPGETASVKAYFQNMDPPPFDFISRMEFEVYRYPVGSGRRLVLANFQAGEDFAPGALYLLEKRGNEYETISNYFVGEKAALIQTLIEEGDPNPVIHAASFGGGTEYMVLQFNGKEFEAVFKKREGDFP